MQITINVKDGATNKDIAATLRHQAALIAGVDPKKAASREVTDVDDDDTDDDDVEEVETKATKKKAAKRAAAAEPEDDDDDDTDTDDADDDDEEVEAAPVKKGKVKKITLEMINDAAKAKAKASTNGRKAVLTILKKKFGVESITDLETDQYPAVMKALA